MAAHTCARKVGRIERDFDQADTAAAVLVSSRRCFIDRQCGHDARAPRTGRGQQIVELAVGLIAMVPVVLLLFDLIVLVIVNSMNDELCRDAARSAAQGRPVAHAGKAADWHERASAVVSQAFKLGGYIAQPPIIVDGESGPLNVVLPSAQYGGKYEGTVRVTIQSAAHLPAAIFGLPQSVTVTARHEYPILFVEPPTTASNN